LAIEPETLVFNSASQSFLIVIDGKLIFKGPAVSFQLQLLDFKLNGLIFSD